MKFLFISETYPSGLTGTSVKTRNTLLHLLNQGYQVDVICINFDTLVTKELKHKNLNIFSIHEEGVRRFRLGWFWRAFQLVFTYKPVIVSRIFNKKIKALFQALEENYDFVIFDGFSTLQYLNKKDNRYIYIDDEDITYLMKNRINWEKNIFHKFFLYTEFLRCSLFEKLKLSKVAQIWAISKDDYQRFKEISQAKVFLMPTLIPDEKNCFSEKSKDLIFVGTLDWRENYLGLRWFIKNCWNQIQEEHPETKLLIVGQQGDDSWQKLAKEYKNIELKGYVKNLSTVFRRSAIAISPIFINVGIKIKVLTYLSYGIPTVSTKIATGGMSSRDGVYLVNKSNFAKRINYLLDDAKLREKLSKEADQNIKEHHSNQALSNFFAKTKIFK